MCETKKRLHPRAVVPPPAHTVSPFVCPRCVLVPAQLSAGGDAFASELSQCFAIVLSHGLRARQRAEDWWAAGVSGALFLSTRETPRHPVVFPAPEAIDATLAKISAVSVLVLVVVVLGRLANEGAECVSCLPVHDRFHVVVSVCVSIPVGRNG